MLAKLEGVVTGLVCLCALVVTARTVRRAFIAPPPPTSQRASVFEPAWDEILSAGTRVGSSSARIQVAEFTDFQCPFCRRYNDTMKALLSRYPRDVAYTIVHFPIPSHRHAQAAAHSAECARVASRFAAMVDALFAKQDSIGLRPWTAYAMDAQVSDTAAFAQCMADSAIAEPINKGLALGQRLDVAGTPTIILNGWRYGKPPSDSELSRAIGDLLASRKPYKGFPQEFIDRMKMSAPTSTASR